MSTSFREVKGLQDLFVCYGFSTSATGVTSENNFSRWMTREKKVQEGAEGFRELSEKMLISRDFTLMGKRKYLIVLTGHAIE